MDPLFFRHPCAYTFKRNSPLETKQGRCTKVKSGKPCTELVFYVWPLLWQLFNQRDQVNSNFCASAQLIPLILGNLRKTGTGKYMFNIVTTRLIIGQAVYMSILPCLPESC